MIHEISRLESAVEFFNNNHQNKDAQQSLLQAIGSLETELTSLSERVHGILSELENDELKIESSDVDLTGHSQGYWAGALEDISNNLQVCFEHINEEGK